MNGRRVSVHVGAHGGVQRWNADNAAVRTERLGGRAVNSTPSWKGWQAGSSARQPGRAGAQTGHGEVLLQSHCYMIPPRRVLTTSFNKEHSDELHRQQVSDGSVCLFVS